MNGIKAEIERIARAELGVETLETRGMDSLDFHSVSVEGIRRALLAAWMGGIQECVEDNEQESSDMSEQITIERDGQPDLRFTGEKIAGTSNSADRGHSDFSGQTGRWTTLRLYRTDGGRYVCHRIEHTQWQGEHDESFAEVCATTDEVQAFFGYGRLAKEIYELAGIEAVQTID